MNRAGSTYGDMLVAETQDHPENFRNRNRDLNFGFLHKSGLIA